MDVSVIVPIYNVEQYVEECLKSVLTQHFESMEVICVDDGSEDDSMKKVIEMAQQDYRIKIIRHEKNRGLSAARNTGLTSAKGKYILFMDSDDVLMPNAISQLYQEAEQRAVDVVYFDYVKLYDAIPNYEKVNHCEKIRYDGIYTGREFFCRTMECGEWKCEVWRQFVKREFLLNHKISFLEGILHEDNLYSFYIAMEARRVCNINKALYYYRQREASIMRTQDVRRAQSMFVILSEIFVYWKTNRFTKKESLYIGKLWESLYRAYGLYSSYEKTSDMLSCGDDVEKAIYRILNNYRTKKWLNVDELLIDELNWYEHVIVYGAGHAAKQVIEYLQTNHVNVSYIMVQNKKDNPSEFCGISVYEVEECINKKDDSVVIIGVTSKFSDGIENRLRSAGYENVISLSDGNTV